MLSQSGLPLSDHLRCKWARRHCEPSAGSVKVVRHKKSRSRCGKASWTKTGQTERTILMDQVTEVAESNWGSSRLAPLLGSESSVARSSSQVRERLACFRDEFPICMRQPSCSCAGSLRDGRFDSDLGVRRISCRGSEAQMRFGSFACHLSEPTLRNGFASKLHGAQASLRIRPQEQG